MISAIAGFFDRYLDCREETPTETREHRIQLASAALMIELCKSDQEIDASETDTLIAILKRKFSLSPETLTELISLAESEVQEATSLYQFTSLLNESYDYGEKIQVIANLWEVAYADGNLDRHEDYLIRKIAELLYVSHTDFIKTKLFIKAKLEKESS